MNERSIFHAALEIEDPTLREAYVARACGTDATLRSGVLKLLEVHTEFSDFMQRPAPGLLTGLDTGWVVEGPGTIIGVYKLLEQIGEGGFGVVFMAEQLRPIARRVALKILKPGMDTRQIVARFEAERQALALMEHPNIAHVFDGGETALGRPYFVMELVRGVPITQYCDDNQLSVRDRLQLFVDVCLAIQHAHQKGIIHRDLKPNNVLITLHDDKAVVKVIDFGIAKVTGQQLTDKTLFTNFTQFVGTPLYMSPEQAQLSGLDVDTRSDIYSLGVLLYELLAGVTPFERERFQTAAHLEIRRIIGEEEPPKPSTRTSTPGPASERISINRRSHRQELSRLLRGELDWIVMKCLEKDRDRRYATASGLASDVERYLNDEPVLACPPSTWYRFQKLVRRNKVPFVATSAVMLLMLAVIVTLVLSNVRIRYEQARAEEAEKLAVQRADEIEQGLERLKSANAMVDTAQFFVDERRWDDASAAFTNAIEARPEHAPAWEGRGLLYASLGLWELMASDLAKAAELQEPATSHRWFLLSLSHAYTGDLPRYRDVCTRMEKRFQGTNINHFTMDLVRAGILLQEAPADPANLASLAEAIVAVDPHVQWFLHVLGAAYYRAGKYEQAVQRLQESLTTNPDWNARAINYPFLAMAYHRLGRHDEARNALVEAERAIDRWTQARYEANAGGYWVISQGATDSWPVLWWDWMTCQLTYDEARNVLGLSPPPNDARLHVLRARAFAGLRWPEKALEEFAAALEKNPGDKQILLENHRVRGYSFALRRQWHEAAAEFARASKLQPDEPYFWWYQAVLQLTSGNKGSYRRICAEMSEHFANTEDPRTAHTVVGTCALLPEALSDMHQLIPLGQISARWYPGSSRMLAAAQCRAGAHHEAVRTFQQAATHYRLRADDLLMLTIAYHHLENDAQAKQCFSKALQWIEEAGHQQLNEPAGVRPGWGNWQEPLCVELLRQEVETLLK